VTRPESDLNSELVASAAERSVTLSPRHLVTLSPFRAWCYLIWLSFQRQARTRQMVWIALGLLAFSAALVAPQTMLGRWSMTKSRHPERYGPTYQEWLIGMSAAGQAAAAPWSAPAGAFNEAIRAAVQAVLDRSELYVFSRTVVFSVFLSFLLPIWSLSFATEALGGEREGSSLVWLLTRPLPRPAIYLAKFVALLPWSLGLNLGGFALLCLLAGRPGLIALGLYWPAVLCASLAFAALFHLMGAWFRRSAIVAIVYTFFLETILGNMPGYMKRVSIGFYARCMMFDAAQDYGVQPEKPNVYLPVDGTSAWMALLGLTVGLLLLGMYVFSRSEYQDLN